MIRCPNCDFENAASSNFCRNCGTTLKPSSPIVVATASAASDAQVQSAPTPASAAPQPTETPLAHVQPTPVAADTETRPAPVQTAPVAADTAPAQPIGMSAEVLATTMEPVTNPTQPLVAPTEPPVPEQTHGVLQPDTKIGEYTIIALRDERDGQRTYRAQAPANVCQQCGTRAEVGAQFCEVCGAQLLPHEVLLWERSIADDGAANGPWRLPELPEDPLRALLPQGMVFEANGQRYLVAEESVPGYQSLAELLAARGEAPQQPAALDESDALPLALQLAHLLEWLHRNNTALGDLSLAQLLVGPKGALRLRNANDLAPLTEGARNADLMQLARTLEDLTRTPRLTQRLDNDDGTTPQPTLDGVLQQGRMGALPDAAAWVAALESVAWTQSAVHPLRAHVGALGNVGMQRQINEDSFLVQEAQLGLTDQLLNAGVYVVADGMGGHEAGEVASRLAVLGVAQTVAQQLAVLAADTPNGVPDDKLNDMVHAAAEAANQAVFAEATRRNNDMGTTLTFAIVVGDRCVVGNVGDSRTYLLHEGKLQRISKDHSLVMRLVEVGQISEDEIYTHPHRNAILRSLGEKPQVEVDLFPLRLEPGDALFLCSDGQWEMVRNPRINEVLNAVDDPQTAVNQLIAEANRNGGEDNITAVLVRFESVSDK